MWGYLNKKILKTMLSNTVAEEKRLDKKGRFIAYQLDLFVTHFTFGGVRTIASSKCTGNFSDIFLKAHFNLFRQVIPFVSGFINVSPV